jgi:hypothetical protein
MARLRWAIAIGAGQVSNPDVIAQKGNAMPKAHAHAHDMLLSL